MSRANVNRPYIDKIHPEVYKSMIQAATASRKVARAAGLSDGLLELVNTRVSQIKLDLLPTWREAEVYDDQEKAALLLAETLTSIDKAADRDAIASNHPVARPRTAEN